MAEIGSKMRRAWAMATLAGGVAAAFTVLHGSTKDTRSVFIGRGAATSEAVNRSSAIVTSSLVGRSSTLSTTLLASSPTSSPTSTLAPSTTTSAAASTTVGPATTISSLPTTTTGAVNERPGKEDGVIAEAAANGSGHRPSSVGEILYYRGKELSDAVEESVHPYKAPPPDGSGIPLPAAPVGTVCAVRATRPSDGFDPWLLFGSLCQR